MASVPDSSLKAGLAALKQGDYSSAIAHLEAVGHDQPSSQAKAQMGLVVAYSKTGAIDRAFELCQILTKSTYPEIQEWANHNYTILSNSYISDAALMPSESDFKEFLPQQTKQAKLPKNSAPIKASRKTSFPNRAEYTKYGNDIPVLGRVLFWLLKIGTATAIFWLIRELLQLSMAFTRGLLANITFLNPLEFLYQDPTQFLLIILGLGLCLSPWLLDGILRWFYGYKLLSIEKLSTHSSETIDVIKSYCQKRKWPLPKLGILPTTAPVALTYGNLPRTARIVVSQGLLAQLADDEIATIYASQLGQIAHGDFIIMSLVILITQIPYTIYRQASEWGDRSAHQILQRAVAVVASLSYGLYYLLGGAALCLSRVRLYYSDRFAANLTGNPYGLTQALLKITIGMAQNIQQQGHTTWLLESWNLLFPVSQQQAISLGSLPPGTDLEPILAWDYLNPARHWLTINNTHPLIGDRLQRLTPSPPHPLTLSPPPLLLSAPFLGILLSLAFGSLFWLFWRIGFMLRLWPLSWMYDGSSFIEGLVLIGFSIGTLARINFFFPDIKLTTGQTDMDLPHLLTSSNVPVLSQPIRLQGKLLGRRRISNWLGQDLILHSASGLIKLHHTSWLGPIGFWLTQSPQPTNLLGQQLTITGWFRRGATPWIDIETMQPQRGATIHSNHPIWSTLLAGGAAIWGIYILWQGV